jgi:apolipoprotein N-acyltransferase
VRGVETGMPMLRAAREGLLTISDAYGRVTASKPSAGLPGATLRGRRPAALPGTTLYTRSGDLFGRRRWIGLVYAKSASSTIR